MCWEVKRVSSLQLSPEQERNLRDYMVAKSKWLLNLTETSLPQHRNTIHFQIFAILLSHPRILQGNDFLHQVLEDLLVQKIPHSLPYLRLLMDHCLTECPSKADRLYEKVVRRGGEGLTLLDKVQLWELLLRSDSKGESLLELYSLFEEQWIAKYCAFRMRGLPLPSLVLEKVEEIKGRMLSEPCCYRPEMELLERWS